MEGADDKNLSSKKSRGRIPVSRSTSNQFELSDGTSSQSSWLTTPSSVVPEFENKPTSVGEIVYESLFVLEIVNLTSA